MRVLPQYRSSRCQRRQAGFTLVELLVAMTLLGFLSVMLFAGLRFGARSWEAVISNSSERDEIATTQRFLRDRLGELTLPGSIRTSRVAEDDAFLGDATQVEFVAPWLSRLSLGGLYRFTLWYEEATDEVAGGGSLMLSWRPVTALPDELDVLEDLAGERVLLGGITEFALSYFGTSDPDLEPEWRDTWDESEQPPLLIRADLKFADARRAWPDFVMALKR